MIIKQKADFSEQKKKSAAAGFIPRAFQFNMNKWGKDTLRYIQLHIKSTGGVFRRTPREINRNLAYMVRVLGPSRSNVVLGTGAFVKKRPVPYAKIQDEGGTVRAKNVKHLWIPWHGVKDPPGSYLPGGDYIPLKKGGWLYGHKQKKTFKPLFILKKSVYLPARFWFTAPIRRRKPELRRLASKAAVLERAKIMSNARGGSKVK